MKLKLTQQAYICDNGLEYRASAVTDNGDVVHVYWDIINPKAELPEDACNWDKPTRAVFDGMELDSFEIM